MGDYASYIEQLSEANLGELSRSGLGPFNFEEISEPLKIIRALIEEADQLGQWLPRQNKTQVQNLCAEVAIQVQHIRSFDPTATGSTPIDTKNRICTNIVNQKDALLTVVSPFIRLDHDKIAGLTQQLEKGLSLVPQITEGWEAIKTDWDERQKTERLKTTVAGTNEASEYFDLRASSHDNAAKKFGFAAGILSVSVIVWSIIGIETPLGSEWKTGQIIESLVKGIPHFTILTLLTFGIGISLRNYRINKHLSVLNKTKSVTLSAGKSFISSVADTSTRDMVLETVVRSVFAIGETGFLQSDGDRTIVESPNFSSLIHAVSNATTPKG